MPDERHGRSTREDDLAQAAEGQPSSVDREGARPGLLRPRLGPALRLGPGRAVHPGLRDRARLRGDGARPQHRGRLRRPADLGYVAFFAIGAYTAGYFG